MSDVSFRNGIDLRKQKLPATDDYLYIEHPKKIIKEAKTIVSNWKDSSAKKRAEIRLDYYTNAIANGQVQLFFIKKDLVPEYFSLLKTLSSE